MTGVGLTRVCSVSQIVAIGAVPRMLNRFDQIACSALVCAVVCTASSRSSGQGQGPPPAIVRLDAVRAETVEQWREVTGEIRAVQRARLAAEEAGLVVELGVEVGDRVEKGHVLARLDDQLRRFDQAHRAGVRQSKAAEVDEMAARREKAARDVARLRELETRGGASQTEIDDASTSLAEAEAQLVRAKADLASAEAEEKSAEQRLSKMTVRAPFSGAVVAKATEVGQWVSEGDTIVEVVALDEVDVYLDIPERFIAQVSRPEVRVQVRIPALGHVLESTVTKVVAEGDRLARTFPVRVRLKAEQTIEAKNQGASRTAMLRPGMSAIGLVPTGEPIEAITIDKDAVMRNDAGAFVYFDAGGSASVAPIEVLFAVGQRVVVRSPVLRYGMKVVTEGNERIFPGQPLAPMGAAPPGAAAPGPGQKAEGG